tara:strand:+ start:85 stop:540 length:456 start_codon:yes stop_codon:yes gene_type:complete
MGKPFKESTVGKMLLGAASLVSPALGGVLSGAISASDAISAITKSSISDEDKIKLQTLIYEQQNKEIEEISNRWNADSISDSWLSKNVRPMILIWCIVVFTIAGIVDSVETIPFQISSLWNDTFENVMMAVVLAYFGGRTTEKAANLFNKK